MIGRKNTDGITAAGSVAVISGEFLSIAGLCLNRSGSHNVTVQTSKCEAELLIHNGIKE